MDVVQQIEQKIKYLLQERHDLRTRVAQFDQQRAHESEALTQLEHRVAQLKDEQNAWKDKEAELQSMIHALEQEREHTKGQLHQLLQAFEELS
ncbi:MAG: hypothetical protein ACKN9J_00080 [Holophagaceae bacterium]